SARRCNRAGSGLRTVITLHDHEIGDRRIPAQRLGLCVFRRAVAVEGGRIVPELDDDEARSALPLDDLALPAAHQETPAELAQRHSIRLHIALVSFWIGHVDLHNPIRLGHRPALLLLAAETDGDIALARAGRLIFAAMSSVANPSVLVSAPT